MYARSDRMYAHSQHLHQLLHLQEWTSTCINIHLYSHTRASMICISMICIFIHPFIRSFIHSVTPSPFTEVSTRTHLYTHPFVHPYASICTPLCPQARWRRSWGLRDTKKPKSASESDQTPNPLEPDQAPNQS